MYLFSRDLFSWNLANPFVFCRLKTLQTQDLCISFLFCWPHFSPPLSPANDALKQNTQHRCSKWAYVCSFQIPLLCFDWGWLSVANMEKWVMSKSCLQPTTWESVQYSHPKSVISFILTHLSSQMSTFKMLRVANNKIVWIIVCWILALSASLSLTHCTRGSLPHSEGRWQTMAMAPQHGSSFNSLSPSVSGMWNWDCTWTSLPLQGHVDSWFQGKNCWMCLSE